MIRGNDVLLKKPSKLTKSIRWSKRRSPPRTQMRKCARIARRQTNHLPSSVGNAARRTREVSSPRLLRSLKLSKSRLRPWRSRKRRINRRTTKRCFARSVSWRISPSTSFVGKHQQIMSKISGVIGFVLLNFIIVENVGSRLMPRCRKRP